MPRRFDITFSYESGSSSVNAMLYVRGNKLDYDRFAENGCEGWSYQDVLPYFLKSEQQTRPSLMNDPYHSTEGSLKVSDLKYHSLSHRFLNASKEIGFEITDDYNGAQQEGAFYFQTTTYQGKRWSTADAFLLPVIGVRPNLHVATLTHVTKVTTEKTSEGLKATGVIVERTRGQPIQVKARKEVILSGGAIGSPQILLLSGIGPSDHLKKMGIPIIHDLPGVGQNLQDHLILWMSFQVNTSAFALANLGPADFYEYLTENSGVLATTGVEAGAFFSSGLRKDPQPDLQFHFLPTGIQHYESCLTTVFSERLVDNSGWDKTDLQIDSSIINGFILAPTILHPKSRGSITLQSSDPFVSPLIDLNYLDEDYDLKALVVAMKKAIEISSAPVFKAVNASVVYHHRSVHPINSDAFFEEFGRKYASTVFHPIGTCKMGRASDKMTVVTPDLKVKGVKGLRVIDASIFPDEISGNTNAPTIMVGEKGADMIKKEYAFQ